MDTTTATSTTQPENAKSEVKNAKTVPQSKPIKAHARATSLDKMYETLVKGLKKFFADNNFKRGVVGVSGGVDSCLTLKIAVDALGAENVTAVLMPELGLSKQENIDHSKILCQYLAVNCYYLPINNFLADFNVAPWKPSPLAKMNTKARVRSVLLYNLANTENCLVLGTSNKSELLLGYGTKYGDLAADVEVIGDLFKTEVGKLANHIGLPPEIVDKTPSAELSPCQTDEQDLGAPYEDLDKVLMKLDLGSQICIEHGLPAALVNLVFRRVSDNKHKTQLPPVIKANEN
ncbi:NAD(+) synthase [Candidatus Peregrinibacteria bacterium]|nr:NAD(+) synthase [Candidatus Peregrinibacteria bacterium]